jgi:hypothetical protein
MSAGSVDYVVVSHVKASGSQAPSYHHDRELPMYRAFGIDGDGQRALPTTAALRREVQVKSWCIGASAGHRTGTSAAAVDFAGDCLWHVYRMLGKLHGRTVEIKKIRAQDVCGEWRT